MSDAMTNREIEDVLTSIRRLVAQDGARSPDRGADASGPGSVLGQSADSQVAGGVTASLPSPTRTPGRLILTDAQRVDAAAGAVADPRAVAGANAGTEATTPSGDNAPSGETSAEKELSGLPSPDFGRLEATIAELEAAVSASGGGWEADSADDQPRASNVTDLYGRLHFSLRREVEAPTAPPRVGEPDLSTGVAPESVSAAAAQGKNVALEGEPAPGMVAAPGNRIAEPDPLAAGANETAIAPNRAVDAGSGSGAPAATVTAGQRGDTDEEGGDEVFRLPPLPEPEAEPARESDGGETILDEAGLQALVAQIVRDELHGQLGERITAQVRKLVRAEIAKALDERKFL